MYFSRTPKKKPRRDAKRGNGGRIKALVYQVGYRKHRRSGGYCIWIKGLTGWSPTGNGYPITEQEAIKQGKQIAKETKSEWIGEWSGLL